jgi:uncharacterized protein
MSIADEIEKLNNLKQKGAITEEEYQNAKASLLRQKESIGEKLNFIVKDVSSDEKMWSMFMHFSQLCGFLIPLLGLVVPIVMWQIKKDESEIIDKHGKIIINWIITFIILAVAFIILFITKVGVFFGAPLLWVLFVAGIVFPIIGGIKANNGEFWPYPFSIKFITVDD